MEPARFAAGHEPGGGVFLAFALFAPGFDDEVTVLHAGIFPLVPSVVLKLGISPTMTADVVIPFFGIGSPGFVEFIGPDQVPAGRGGGRLPIRIPVADKELDRSGQQEEAKSKGVWLS